jgi:hypothetical protein
LVPTFAFLLYVLAGGRIRDEDHWLRAGLVLPFLCGPPSLIGWIRHVVAGERRRFLVLPLVGLTVFGSVVAFLGLAAG